MRAFVVLSITVLTFVFPSICSVATAAEDPVDWDKASPAQIHQRLWQSKAAAHMDKEISRKIAGLSRVSRTQTNYDVKFYGISIRVDDTTEIIYGRVTFLATATIDDVSQIQVDFYDDMTVDSIVSPAGLLLYSRNSNVVTVTLETTYNTDEEFQFEFNYHGHPTEGGFQAFAFDTRLGSKVISTLSEPYFARTWWPCKDRMDDKADSFDIAVEVDTALYVASNGTLDSLVSGGNSHTFYYSVGYPMASYLFSLAISNYTVWFDEWVYNAGQDTMPLVHAVYPDRYTYSLTHYDVTPGALTVFSDNYGHYPFSTEKYGHANFEWGGAMEHQTMSSMTGSNFGFSTPVVVHEMAHQWFGDMITCESWSDIWLNEGWASYSEALYYLETEGWASYQAYMNGMAYSGGGTIYIYDTTSVWNIFGSIVYDKGAWVVHMLRGVLGDSLFYAGVDAYYNSEFQHAAATTADFKNVFEAASGMELDWFFDEWIFGTYRPNYRWSLWQEPADTGGQDVFLRIWQIQTTDPEIFTMPVDFFFDFNSDPDDTITLWVDDRATMHKFNFSDVVNGGAFDPSDWILKYEFEQNWQLYIITLPEELSAPVQYTAYGDTVEARGGSGNNLWSISQGSLPDGFTLDNKGVISGLTSDTGQFTFTVHVDEINSAREDDVEFSLHVAPLTYVPGDVDNSGEMNVADLSYLVDYLFLEGSPPVLMNAADVDSSCEVDVADLNSLVDYLFLLGEAPVAGCVN